MRRRSRQKRTVAAARATRLHSWAAPPCLYCGPLSSPYPRRTARSAITQSFDYIVVGAGSAGCVIAARLAQRGDVRVLLIEAGGRDVNPLYRIPLAAGSLLRWPRGNWSYFTTPQAQLNGRELYWPRGKVIGGSSSINGMVYVRGLASDYDGWAASGLTGWSYEQVLPYFRRSEMFLAPAGMALDAQVHGTDGPVPVSRPAPTSPLFDTFIDAGRALGLPLADDFNVACAFGVGRYDFTIKDGQRWSASRAFLPLAQNNLTVITQGHATRILFERGRARTLELVRHGQRDHLRAEREIIIAAGVIGSPALLMHSGIGPADALRKLGIEVQANRREVGQNLRDHLLARVEHVCTEPVTLYDVLRPMQLARAVAAQTFGKRGPAANFPLLAGAYLKSAATLTEPDLQSHFCAALSTASIRLPGMRRATPAHDGHGFFANVYTMRPRSTGTVSLRSADPLAPPAIDPQYLSDGDDLVRMRRGVRLLRELFAQQPFDRYRGSELAPGTAHQSDAELDAWIRASAESVFHPVGTCRMGADSESVVDERLRVRGFEGLRVVDASIMPSLPSTNTHAATMMIAEKAAELICTDQPA